MAQALQSPSPGVQTVNKAVRTLERRPSHTAFSRNQVFAGVGSFCEAGAPPQPSMAVLGGCIGSEQLVFESGWGRFYAQ